MKLSKSDVNGDSVNDVACTLNLSKNQARYFSKMDSTTIMKFEIFKMTSLLKKSQTFSTRQ